MTSARHPESGRTRRRGHPRRAGSGAQAPRRDALGHFPRDLHARAGGAVDVASASCTGRAFFIPVPVPFDALPFEVAVAIGVFAVADLVAAVGLWLVAPWGGALWLATAAGELIAGAFLARLLGARPVMVGAYAAPDRPVFHSDVAGGARARAALKTLRERQLLAAAEAVWSTKFYLVQSSFYSPRGGFRK